MAWQILSEYSQWKRSAFLQKKIQICQIWHDCDIFLTHKTTSQSVHEVGCSVECVFFVIKCNKQIRYLFLDIWDRADRNSPLQLCLTFPPCKFNGHFRENSDRFYRVHHIMTACKRMKRNKTLSVLSQRSKLKVKLSIKLIFIHSIHPIWFLVIRHTGNTLQLCWERCFNFADFVLDDFNRSLNTQLHPVLKAH